MPAWLWGMFYAKTCALKGRISVPNSEGFAIGGGAGMTCWASRKSGFVEGVVDGAGNTEKQPLGVLAPDEGSGPDLGALTDVG
ncbi:hypothetical protein ACC759_37535, partial [Rhizobium ruizarguesonis]